MKRKKFSEFELPTNEARNIFLVGYEVGTGEDGENKSVRVLASDLAFNVAGVSGVSSVNGLSGAITLEVGEGLTMATEGNLITLTGSSSSDITVDDSFNAQSTNPQSGIAIGAELANYANLNNSNTFTGDNQMNNLNVVGRFRANGSAAFNSGVTVQGENLVQHMTNSNLHIADSSIHLTTGERDTITQSSSHIADSSIHTTEAEKTAITESIDSKADMSLFMDQVRIFGYQDYSLTDVATGTTEVQGISKVQICSNHRWQDTALLQTVTIPQNHSQTDYTTDTPFYLVLFGDIGNDTWEFVAYSDNTQVQLAGGEDLVFTFSTHPDLAVYEALRLFYTTDISTTPTEPTTEAEYSNLPKMAFNALITDDSCKIWQSNNVEIGSRTTNATFNTYTVVETEEVIHPNNSTVHLDEIQKQGLLELLSRKDELLALLS